MRPIQSGINSPCRTSAPWAPVCVQRCSMSENNWGRPDDSERPRMPALRMAGGTKATCARFSLESTVERDIGALGACRHTTTPEIRKPNRSLAPSAPVCVQRRPTSESNWGRPDDSERPRMLLLHMADESRPICARYSPRSSTDQDIGYWAPLRAGRLACIHGPAGAMSRHRPRLAPGIGRETR